MTADQQHAVTTDFNAVLATGFETGNFDEIGGFYTDGSSLMPPRGTLLEGRGPIAAFWLGVRNRFSGAVFTTTSTKTFGEEMLREAGTYVMAPKGEQGTPVQGKYLFVWQFVDGEWQIESSIWNRNAEPAGGRRRAGGQAGQAGRGPGGRQGGGGYRQGGGQAGGAAGDGYRQGGGQGRRSGIAGGAGIGGGGGRPSFQGGGGGGGGRQGGGQRQGGGRGQGGQAGYGGGNSYDGGAGLYSNLKD